MANISISNLASGANAAASSSVPRPIVPPSDTKPDAVAPTPVVKPEVPQQSSSVQPQLEQVQQAIERVKQSIKPPLGNSLDFQVDQSTGKTVVRITDLTTNTLVRQIPSEEMLTIAKALDAMQGRGGLLKGQA